MHNDAVMTQDGESETPINFTPSFSGTLLDQMYNMVYNSSMLDILRANEFVKWLKRLKDVNARACINVRLKRISLTGDLGDTKPVGDGVYELRVDCSPRYRVYYSQRGKEILLLLIGGGKSSQQKDTEKAKKINVEYE